MSLQVNNMLKFKPTSLQNFTLNCRDTAKTIFLDLKYNRMQDSDLRNRIIRIINSEEDHNTIKKIFKLNY